MSTIKLIEHANILQWAIHKTREAFDANASDGDRALVHLQDKINEIIDRLNEMEVP